MGNEKIEKSLSEELHLQKAYFQQLFENSPEGIVMLDNNDRILMVNKAFEDIFGYKMEEIRHCQINDLVVPDHFREEGDDISDRIHKGATARLETVRKRKDGTLIHVAILGYPIYYKGRQVGIYGIYTDITQRKNTEERLRYISMHDSLTGLYNRSYFEEQVKLLQQSPCEMLGIIVCDIDGLKIVNDTLGHDKGDEMLLVTSEIIKSCLSSLDFAARFGGDEFVIILPGKTAHEVENIIRMIREKIFEYNLGNNNLPINFSMGYAVSSNEEPKNINDLFIEADNNMYRDKIHGGKSARSSIVQTLTTALEARDFITEGHTVRLQKMIQNMAGILNLPERTINELKLLAQFHDIGKVGIPDRILFKPGPLTSEEKRIMRRHSEIGARIARSSPELLPISDWIFKHHEWWNGNGYPLGLAGEEIPLECRILAIADAYDSMTSDRPYRKAMTHSQAIAEIYRFSGTQFDPTLVELLVPVLKRIPS